MFKFIRSYLERRKKRIRMKFVLRLVDSFLKNPNANPIYVRDFISDVYEVLSNAIDCE